MKSIYKWLVPDFLRRWDGVLLERYPVFWRTGAHFVVFYALVGAVVLFGAGFLYPVHRDGKDWVVDPIKPIEFGYDNMYIYPLVLVLTFSLLWVYRQFQAGISFHQLKHTLLTLIIYAGCFWFLVGITASTFRMGTIVKTAIFWMKAEDLKTFKSSKIYPYGFVLLDEDTTSIIPVDTLTFFRKREELFNKIWRKEEEILRHNYDKDIIYWVHFFEKLGLFDPSYEGYRSYLRNLRDRSYRSYPSYPSYLYFEENFLKLSDLSYLNYLSKQLKLSEMSYLWHEPYVKILSDRFDRQNLSDLSELTDVTHRTYRAYRLKQLYQLDVSYRGTYSTIYKQRKFEKLELLALKYGITNHLDTFKSETLIISPSLPSQIEDSVRSVTHAREFLLEGIFWRHFFQIRYYLLFLVSILFFIPFLSLRIILQIGIMVSLAWGAWSFFELNDNTIYRQNWRIIHFWSYLILPIIGLIALMWMLFKKQQSQFFKIYTSMIFMGTGLTLLRALNYSENKTLTQFGSPLDDSFYGAQLIGLIAACLIPYVQALPKKQ